jgi:hypothetical protein
MTVLLENAACVSGKTCEVFKTSEVFKMNVD